MDERIKFEVEESGFFENNFLAKEGFIKRERFSAMFGLVGLAEAVNILLEKEGIEGRYGHSDIADKLVEKYYEELLVACRMKNTTNRCTLSDSLGRV